jgi:hypothetical protein
MIAGELAVLPPMVEVLQQHWTWVNLFPIWRTNGNEAHEKALQR